MYVTGRSCVQHNTHLVKGHHTIISCEPCIHLCNFVELRVLLFNRSSKERCLIGCAAAAAVADTSKAPVMARLDTEIGT